MDSKALVTWLIIGLVAGFLASLVVGGGGLLRYLVTGIIGSFVGGYLAQQFNIKLGLGNEMLEQIIVATVGAVIVVLISGFIL